MKKKNDELKDELEKKIFDSCSNVFSDNERLS